MKRKTKTGLPIQTMDPSGPHLDVPFWDVMLRQLHFRGECIKAFKSPAENQEAILFAFQQSGWVPTIANPLLPDPEVDRHRQLEYAVRRLNRNQHPQRLRFHVCDYGKKISWEVIPNTLPARKRHRLKKKRRKTM